MSLRSKYNNNQLRLAIQYRRARIPEGCWFHKYPNPKQVKKACLMLDQKKWIVIFSREVIVQTEFIAEILKQRYSQRPRFIDFATFILTLSGRYTKYDELTEDDFGLLGVAGIRHSSYYKEMVGEVLTYLNKAFMNDAGLILGFQEVAENKLRSVYGAEMMDFIQQPKFVYFKM